ncbi:MAG: hypothetical protein CMG46_03220 [Candidatus Marinimicrobia bacterium]|nr:hypothetical protein [Candidatus Neomarinimicrobiota bacterium]
MARAGTKTIRLAAAENAIAKPLVLSSNSSPEDIFLATVPLAKRRLRGQFFTPTPIAKLMAEWVCGGTPERVLDPAAGTGILLRAVAEVSKAPIMFTAFEIDPKAADLARTHGPAKMDVRTADFLQNATSESFDGVIANPPYVRHHDASYTGDVMGSLSKRTGINFSRLSNIYVPFIVKCFEALVDGGRAAVIAPTEWTNANFGAGLKKFLYTHDALRDVIYFSHTDTIFSDNLSTACILLMEKKSRRNNEVRGWFLDSGTRLPSLNELKPGPGVKERIFSGNSLYSARKWNPLFAHGTAIQHPGLVPLSAIATTKRGLATGANYFFHLSRVAARKSGLCETRLLRCIGKAADVQGLDFTEADFRALEMRERRTRLVDLRGDLTPEEEAYVQGGEASGLSERYLLQARKPWYVQEQRTPAPIWAAVFGRTSMRFILNTAKVQSLTTFHGIYPHVSCKGLKEDDFAKALCACLNSDFVQTQSSLERRVYGSGLMKFEPRDLLHIKVPDLRQTPVQILNNLCITFDALVRKDTTENRAALNSLVVGLTN